MAVSEAAMGSIGVEDERQSIERAWVRGVGHGHGHPRKSGMACSSMAWWTTIRLRSDGLAGMKSASSAGG
jgi:hypothetical protein